MKQNGLYVAVNLNNVDKEDTELGAGELKLV